MDRQKILNEMKSDNSTFKLVEGTENTFIWKFKTSMRTVSIDKNFIHLTSEVNDTRLNHFMLNMDSIISFKVVCMKIKINGLTF